MAPAAKDVTTPTETETLDIAIERGKSGGFGIAIMAGSNGGAYVEYVQDMAKEQNVIKPGDHITHVEGEGPLTNGVVMEKLRAGGAKVGLRVIRGEKIKRKEAGSSSRWATVFAIVAGVAAIATSVWPPEQWFSDLSLSGSTVMSVRDILSDDDEKPRERGPVIKIAGQMFTLEADGSAANPDEVRAAMRSDASMMGQIRKNEPMWAATVAGRPDGTYDVDKFQKMMRRNFVSFTTHQATKVNEDGTAVDPAAYLKMALKDKKWVGQVKKMSDTQLKERILKGEPEGLQQMLRGQRARDEAQKAADEAPPPPPTPYDEMGQVDMSFRILTDEGEEKDLYSLRPKMVEEERWQLPLHMQCAACEAAAHQGALAVSAALKAMHKDDFVGVTALEAVQDVCADEPLFTREYGVEPTKAGQNAISGPGITAKPGGFHDDTGVMLQTAHSSEWGKKLSVACKEYLGGSEYEEEELAAAIMKADKTGDADAGPKAFKAMICQQACGLA